MIERFNSISMEDVGTCWGKGASLWEMTQAGFPIPNGFVVTTKAFGVSPNERDEEVLDAFDLLNSQFVAVRSSGTREDGSEDSFAWQFNTYLFVTKEQLIEKILECHHSVNSDRIRAYCESKNIDYKEIKVAVVIQRMIDSDVSWVCFTIEPVSGDTNKVMIEAGYGIWEAIVSGMITPDNYLIDKQSWCSEKNISTQVKKLVINFDQWGTREETIQMEFGNQQKLSDNHISELTALAKKIEKHYQKPMDIEWAVENDALYILQARPITTLGNYSQKEKKNSIQYRWKEYRYLITRNLSVLQQSILVKGIYNNFDFFWIDRFEELFITKDWIHTSIFAGLESSKKYKQKTLEFFKRKENMEIIIQKYVDIKDKTIASITQCVERLDIYTWNDFVENYGTYCAWFVVTAMMGITYHGVIINLLKEKWFQEYELDKIISTITYPETITPFMESQMQMLEIWKKIQSKELQPEFVEKELYKWLSNYGIIPVNFVDDPWDIADAKEQLENVLKLNCEEQLLKIRENHREKNTEKNALLKEIWDEQISYVAYLLEVGTYLNEYRKNKSCYISFHLQKVLQDLSQTYWFDNRKDLYYLLPDEIWQLLKWEDINLREIVKKRAKFWAVIKENGVWYHILTQEEIKDIEAIVASQNQKEKDNIVSNNGSWIEIKGYSANQWKIAWIAKIILSSKDFNKLQTWEILVTNMTSVDFVPIMSMAWWFITDEWWLTCHAAIVAREMNKPCIIWTKVATQILKDWDLIELDAERGIVKILEK